MTTSEHPNVARLRGFYDLFMAGDLAGFLDLCADDVVVRVGGTNTLAGTYEGREEVTGYVMRLAAQMGPAARLDLDAILAGDRHGAMIVGGQLPRSDGSVFASRAAFAFRFDGQARITEWVFLPSDQAGWDAYFSEPMGAAAGT